MPSTPAEILATPAHAYRGWRLHTRYTGCRNYNIVAIAELPDRLHSLTVAEIITPTAVQAVRGQAAEFRRAAASHGRSVPDR